MGPPHTQLWPVARITLRQGIRGCNARGREFDHIDPALARSMRAIADCGLPIPM